MDYSHPHLYVGMDHSHPPHLSEEEYPHVAVCGDIFIFCVRVGVVCGDITLVCVCVLCVCGDITLFCVCGDMTLFCVSGDITRVCVCEWSE